MLQVLPKLMIWKGIKKVISISHQREKNIAFSQTKS